MIGVLIVISILICSSYVESIGQIAKTLPVRASGENLWTVNYEVSQADHQTSRMI